LHHKKGGKVFWQAHLSSMGLSGNIIGLDIGQSHVTAVRVAQDEDGTISTLQLAEVGLPRSTFDAGGNLLRPEMVTEAVKTLRGSAGIKGKKAVMALNGAALTIQPVSRPNNLWGETLEGSIRLELEPGLPYDRNQAHIALRELSRDDKENGTVKMLSVAVRTDLPEALTAAVKKGGLQIVDVLPGPAVLPVAIQTGLGAELLLAIGMLSSSVLLLRDGELHYAQTIPLGSDHFTGALTTTGMSAAEAERWKRTHSLVAPEGAADPHPQQRVALMAAADSLVEAVYQVITYDASEGVAGGVSRLLLCGGGSQLSGLSGYLNRSLALPVELAQPAAGLEVADISRFPQHALAYSLAIGEGLSS
jgi:type IV pilus assembly protein PilM